MLEIANLSHTYANGTVALEDVNLSIPRGRFGLLGPNGAGKSTLMRTVATLQEPTAGTIRFGDIDVLAEPARLRKTLGYLPQDFGVYPRVSASAMLDQMAVLKGITGKSERKSVVETLLAQTNLWAVRDKNIAGFSGGMRQRFGIAQALIGNPELIIVDEPTAGLDPEERNRFLNLLAGIGDNVVVILSTHIVDDVADLCPLMAVLVDGRVRLQGKPADLIASTRGRVWKKEIDHSELEQYQAKHEVISTRLFAGNTIVHVLSDTQPQGFEPVEGGLEDVYFSTLSTLRRAACRGAETCCLESPGSKSAISCATRFSGSRPRSSSSWASALPPVRTSASARPARSTRTRLTQSPSPMRCCRSSIYSSSPRSSPTPSCV